MTDITSAVTIEWSKRNQSMTVEAEFRCSKCGNDLEADTSLDANVVIEPCESCLDAAKGGE